MWKTAGLFLKECRYVFENITEKDLIKNFLSKFRWRSFPIQTSILHHKKNEPIKGWVIQCL